MVIQLTVYVKNEDKTLRQTVCGQQEQLETVDLKFACSVRQPGYLQVQLKESTMGYGLRNNSKSLDINYCSF